MPCLPSPALPQPSLPLPITVAPPPAPIPKISSFCCKLPPIPVSVPPVSFTGAMPPAIPAAIAAARKAVLKYLDAIPLSCPKET